MPVLSLQQADKLFMEMLAKAGIPQPDADDIYNVFLLPSLRGHDSHGLRMLSSTVERFLNNKDAAPSIGRETPATAVIDGRGAPGSLVGVRAARLAVQKARTTGVSTVTFRNVSNLGALGCYVELIAREDMIGLVFSRFRAPVSPPYGGAAPVLGSNPLAVAIPTGKGYPVLIDMATTAIATQALLQLLDRSSQVPPGLLLDSDGLPTTDVSKYQQGQNRLGSQANLTGGPKGYALQLMIDLITTPLSGMTLAEETAPGSRPGNLSLLMAINISLFCPILEFKAVVDYRIDAMKSSKKSPGVDEIFVPGERSFATEKKRRREGIPLSERDWKPIVDLCRTLDVNLEAILGAQAPEAKT